VPRFEPAAAPAAGDDAALTPAPARAARPVRLAFQGPGAVLRSGVRLPPEARGGLEPGDVVELPSGSRVELLFDGGARVRVRAPERRARVRAEGAGAGRGLRGLHLDEGELAMDLPAQADTRALDLTTAQARVLASGSARVELRVVHAMTRVEVVRGSASVTRAADGEVLDLEAGQFALVSPEEDLRPRDVPDRLRATPADPVLLADPRGTALMRFDFEDGRVPRGFVEGAVAPGPPREGSKTSLAGTLYDLGGRTNTVRMLASSGALFRFAPDLVLSFRYWLGADARDLGAQVKHRAVYQGEPGEQNFAIHIRDIVREEWARATIRLVDMKPQMTDRQRQMKTGEEIIALTIWGGERGKGPLYVDDVEILQFPPGLAPPTTAHAPEPQK
jgi:hypothetical protein